MTQDTSQRSITFVVPALNEEGSLAGAVSDFLLAVNGRFSSYEIILIDDGSTDQTGAIADQIAAKNPLVKVIHHACNMGIGFSLREGYGLATKDYVIWGPSDRGLTVESFTTMFDHLNEADILIPFIANPSFRPLSRQMISRAYVLMLNLLFGLGLRYYNAPIVYRTKIIQHVKATSTGFSFAAELLILTIKAGYTYLEIPTIHLMRACGASKAISMKNLTEVFQTLTKLAWDVHFGASRHAARVAPGATQDV